MVPPPRDAFHLRLDRMGQAKDFIAEHGVAFRSPFFSPSQKRIEQRGECHPANESEQIFKIRVVTNAPSIVRCGGNSSHRIFIRVRPTELHRHFLEEGQPQDRDDSQQRQADNRSHPTRETEITSIVESGKNRGRNWRRGWPSRCARKCHIRSEALSLERQWKCEPFA